MSASGVPRHSSSACLSSRAALGQSLASTLARQNVPGGLDHDSPGIENPVTHVTHTLQDSYTYDADDNLTSQTQSDLTGGDPSRTTSYQYNDHDQLVVETDPAGATTGGGSQSEGASSANPQGATTAYSYDPFRNIASETDPNGNTYRYSYNEYQEPTQAELQTTSTGESSADSSCTAPWVADSDGRQAAPGIPFTFWLYWATIARIGYMRQANNGREWDECEAEYIYDNFISVVGINSNEMSDALCGRYEISFQVNSRMAGELAMTVKAMARLSQLLPAHKRHDLERWVSMAEKIRHFTRSGPDHSSS